MLGMPLIKFLKGSNRIVLQELHEMIADDQSPSISSLADRSAYTERTVQRALGRLREQGIIEMAQVCRGAGAIYTICDEDDWFPE